MSSLLLLQLLAAAEEDMGQQADELALLRRSVDAQSRQLSTAEGRLAEEQRRRLELEREREVMVAASAEQAVIASSQSTELALARADLQRTREKSQALAEGNARLEVSPSTPPRSSIVMSPALDQCLLPPSTDITPPSPATMLQVEAQRAQHDLQAAELLGRSLREQLAARDCELGELAELHDALQAEHLAASSALAESQASLTSLQARHDGLAASSAERAQHLESSLLAEQGALSEARRELAAARGEGQALQRELAEATAREGAVASQIRQLAGAHEAMAGKLRREVDARRGGDDELQAVRAGLQASAVLASWWAAGTTAWGVSCCCLRLHIRRGAEVAAFPGISHPRCSCPS